MRKSWYNRLLLSYVPILFITITILTFIAVSLINEISVQETEKANQIFTKYVMDSMETSLRGIERMVLEEIGNNDKLKNFFESNGSTDQRLENYEVSRELGKMVSDNSLIYSIYLYRNADQTVLSRNLIERLDNFGDKAFVQSVYKEPTSLHWSSVRDYKELATDPNQKVITLSKRALLPFGDQGIVVVNVRVDALLRIVDQMINSKITFMDIWSGSHDHIYPFIAPVEKSQNGQLQAQGKITTQIYSDYIGWNFVSGLKVSKIYGLVSFISRMWLGIGIATILLSVLYMIYVTRRNYKPIKTIMQQIHAYQNRGDAKGSGSDEFAFIGKVLDSLIDQTEVYEKQYQEDLLVRRKQFFLELIEGNSTISSRDWKAHMSQLNLPDEFQHLAFAVVEIDQYSEFKKKYSHSDQNLLKFGMTNVLQEFAAMEGAGIWCEWISGQRLAVLFIFNGTDAHLESCYTLLDKFRTWIMVNLKQSVTVGLGGATNDVSHIHQIFKSSIAALQYKMSAGLNRVLSFSELQETASNDTHKYVQIVNGIVPDFRLMNRTWEATLERLFDEMEEAILGDAEVRYVLHYLIRLFNQEMEDLPMEASLIWSDKVYPSLMQLLEESETLEQICPQTVYLLQLLYEHYAAIREANTHHSLISKIRKYIEDNYANPDLSLNHISEMFGVNGKYASQLFKEEFGMKFVDFLVNLRMDHAKTLLLQTDDSINDIAVKVGYIHAISFGRTFKKVVGVTPGDYRKYM
ncbi:helix-turn-helix domain-containing protein [Paenibacillus sp. GCM10027628]|uniref:AraC family transcriptional regulator n=1 Tax=Paenibacillus sp. GCM10027628 TaxID=3273413 RepID=UPI00362AE440